jgi:hypothetical protein
MSKSVVALLLTVALTASLFIFKVAPASAATPKPSVPEFTLKYVDYSYDVPPKTTSTTDPYTNEKTTTTTPGYHVENKTIQATINNNLSASYYNFRYKGRYEDEWSYYPFDPNASLAYMLPDAYAVPYKPSTSDYTVAALPSYYFEDIPENGEVDVQVQALFGDFRAVPYVHLFPLPAPTYDFYFEGTTSDWSNTQTVTIGESKTPTPSLVTPEIVNIILGAVIVAVVFGAALGLLIYLIKRK